MYCYDIYPVPTKISCLASVQPLKRGESQTPTTINPPPRFLHLSSLFLPRIQFVSAANISEVTIQARIITYPHPFIPDSAAAFLGGENEILFGHFFVK